MLEKGECSNVLPFFFCTVSKIVRDSYFIRSIITMMKQVLFGLFLSLFLFSYAQNENVVGNFSVSELNEKVLLTWSIKQGHTCNGIQILRSTDSINYTPIGSINGVCGSNQSDTPYEFTDLFPEKNTTNYYRLNMGGVGFSKVLAIEIIDPGMNSYLLRPNPVFDISELHFNNEAKNDIAFTVFTPNGTAVYSTSTIDEVILLNSSNFNSGFYLFTLVNTTNRSVVNGKFFVP